ncbi:MAG: type II toxin-antitoxin system VapC family toxin [Chloracidobacterium sp.]|nr:type II toxin-antitoxin system VapC family toxin [Chloracidobacterium sp.]
MNLVFADTVFFAGIINPQDQWHEAAVLAETNLLNPHYITTESVLTEVLTFFCEYGPLLRLRAVEIVELILADQNTEVIPISHEIFLEGVDLYKKRPDKSYSLTDCISINICRSREIKDVLSHDRHFSQEGLNILM